MRRKIGPIADGDVYTQFLRSRVELLSEKLVILIIIVMM